MDREEFENELLKLIKSKKIKEANDMIFKNATNNVELLDVALIVAVRENEEGLVKILIENDADLYFDSGYAFYIACLKGKTNLMQYFIKAGIDLNYQNPLFLEAAVSGNNINVLNILIANKIHITANDNYVAINACKKGYLDCLKILLENGATVTSNKNIYNQRGIYLAADNNHLNIVQYLISEKIEKIKILKYKSSLTQEVTDWINKYEENLALKEKLKNSLTISSKNKVKNKI